MTRFRQIWNPECYSLLTLSLLFIIVSAHKFIDFHTNKSNIGIKQNMRYMCIKYIFQVHIKAKVDHIGVWSQKLELALIMALFRQIWNMVGIYGSFRI